jgi:Flp pilus assembly protein TadG
MTQQQRPTEQKWERGTVMVIVALALTALLLFGALAIDIGAVYSSRTQSQNAADSAALAAAEKMIVPPAPNSSNPATVDLDSANGARAAAVAFADANATVGEAVTQDKSGNRFGGVTVRPVQDVAFGSWDVDTSRFTELSGADLSNPEKVRAAKVTVHMDGSTNGKSPAFLTRLLGSLNPSISGGYEVTNEAIAYLGFRGSFTPNDFNLPVAMNSCQLAQNDNTQCGSDFCANTNRPATCPLERGQPDTNGLICGEFSNTAQQNMCWTTLGNAANSTDPNALENVVCDGRFSTGAQSGDPVYVDNGDKTNVVDYIRDRFYGCGQFQAGGNGNGGGQCAQCAGGCGAAGHDEYGTGFINSWVVKLPVVECQDANHCSHSETPKIIGGVCFEIREVIAPQGVGAGNVCLAAPQTGTSRWIRGRPLCRDSTNQKIRELYNRYCVDPNNPPPDSGPGGCDFGFDADHVVLVQ